MGMWQNLKGKRKFELWFKQTFKLRRNAADKNIHDFNILVRFFSTSFIKSAFCHQRFLKWLLLKFIHQVLPGYYFTYYISVLPRQVMQHLFI